MFFKYMDNMGIKESVDNLCKVLREDPELYSGYQANIAMSFKDLVEYNKIDEEGLKMEACVLSRKDVHEIANQAAKNFLDLLIREEEKEL